MNIPFLDLKKVNSELEPEILKALRSVVGSGWYILGKQGEVFEAHCKRSLVGEQEGYVTGCNSGTDALILSLLASRVGPGDEVITVSHTAIPTISAICAVGAIPVFVDIDPSTWVMDVDKVPKAITKKTKAVIPVHLYGNMVDMDRLSGLFMQEGISIIEDVAQAQGSTFADRQAGTLGRFGAFSFYPSKNIGALGDGGAIFCSSAEDRDALRSLRNYGQKDRYHAEIGRGINSRLDEMQAAILDLKLDRLTDWMTRKSLCMDRFRQELSTLPLKFQQVTDRCLPAWHLCVIALETKDIRDRLMTHLRDDGVQTLIHYPVPTHLQPAFRSDRTGALPRTEELAGRILSLPLNTAMTDEEVAYVIRSIRSFFGK